MRIKHSCGRHETQKPLWYHIVWWRAFCSWFAQQIMAARRLRKPIYHALDGKGFKNTKMRIVNDLMFKYESFLWLISKKFEGNFLVRQLFCNPCRRPSAGSDKLIAVKGSLETITSPSRFTPLLSVCPLKSRYPAIIFFRSWSHICFRDRC